MRIQNARGAPAGCCWQPRLLTAAANAVAALLWAVEAWEGATVHLRARRGADADALIMIALLTSRVGRCGKITGGGVPSAPSPGYNASLSLARSRFRSRIRILGASDIFNTRIVP
jgi:hypothetical protein